METPPLTCDEQAEVVRHLGLVGMVARGYLGRGMDYDELVDAGVFGLTTAIRRYDKGRGAKFSSFASGWIRDSIQTALMNEAPLIRLPNWLVQALRDWDRLKRDLFRKLGRPPTNDEIATAVGLTPDQFELVLRALPTRRSRTDFSLPNRHPVSRGAAESEAELSEQVDALRLAVAGLDERTRRVIELRFGPDGERVTLKQVGEILGLTKERARQIEAKALGDLRESLCGHG